jgi:hypothetical protein
MHLIFAHGSFFPHFACKKEKEGWVQLARIFWLLFITNARIGIKYTQRLQTINIIQIGEYQEIVMEGA